MLEGMQASVAAAHGFNGCSSWALEHRPNSCSTRAEFCSATYGIFPDQGSNLCVLHWQANSLPLSHQGRPGSLFSFSFFDPHSRFLGSQFPGQGLNSGHISETQNPNLSATRKLRLLLLLLLFSHSVVSDSATPWTAARQAFLSFTISQSLPKFISIESVMPSNHPQSSLSPPAFNLSQHPGLF